MKIKLNLLLATLSLVTVGVDVALPLPSPTSEGTAATSISEMIPTTDDIVPTSHFDNPLHGRNPDVMQGVNPINGLPAADHAGANPINGLPVPVQAGVNPINGLPIETGVKKTGKGLGKSIKGKPHAKTGHHQHAKPGHASSAKEPGIVIIPLTKVTIDGQATYVPV